ncbi:MAG: hypothetical protein AB3N64_06430 [Puniceicoccaceae bacterium]
MKFLPPEFNRVQCSKVIWILRVVLNYSRNLFLFKVKYRKVAVSGFTRVSGDIKIGNNVDSVSLGNCVQIGPECIIDSAVAIRDHVLIAKRVSFVGRKDHNINVPGESVWSAPRGKDERIIINSDCWIGHGCTILAGVEVGRGSVIAAGSVVVKSVPPYSVVGGNPAKLIRQRFEEKEIAQHERNLREKFGL